MHIYDISDERKERDEKTEHEMEMNDENGGEHSGGLSARKLRPATPWLGPKSESNALASVSKHKTQDDDKTSGELPLDLRNEATYLKARENAYLNSRDTAHLNPREAMHLNRRESAHSDSREAAHLNPREAMHLNPREAAHLKARLGLREAARADLRESAYLNSPEFESVELDPRETAHLNRRESAHIDLRESADVTQNDSARRTPRDSYLTLNGSRTASWLAQKNGEFSGERTDLAAQPSSSDIANRKVGLSDDERDGYLPRNKSAAAPKPIGASRRRGAAAEDDDLVLSARAASYVYRFKVLLALLIILIAAWTLFGYHIYIVLPNEMRKAPIVKCVIPETTPTTTTPPTTTEKSKLETPNAPLTNSSATNKTSDVKPTSINETNAASSAAKNKTAKKNLLISLATIFANDLSSAAAVNKTTNVTGNLETPNAPLTNSSATNKTSDVKPKTINKTDAVSSAAEAAKSSMTKLEVNTTKAKVKDNTTATSNGTVGSGIDANKINVQAPTDLGKNAALGDESANKMKSAPINGTANAIAVSTNSANVATTTTTTTKTTTTTTTTTKKPTTTTKKPTTTTKKPTTTTKKPKTTTKKPTTTEEPLYPPEPTGCAVPNPPMMPLELATVGGAIATAFAAILGALYGGMRCDTASIKVAMRQSCWRALFALLCVAFAIPTVVFAVLTIIELKKSQDMLIHEFFAGLFPLACFSPTARFLLSLLLSLGSALLLLLSLLSFAFSFAALSELTNKRAEQWDAKHGYGQDLSLQDEDEDF